MSHKDIGWEQFTDKVISVISEQKRKSNICLMGFACAKQNTTHKYKTHNYKIAAPISLISASWFFGSKPFSQINQNLEQEIIW